MNAIVFDRGALWFSVPEGNRPCGSRLEHRLADCLADQLGDAAPRPGGSRAQRLEFFPGEVNLGFFHVCHFVVTTDICQGPGVAAAVLHDQAGIGGWWSLAQPLRTLR